MTGRITYKIGDLCEQIRGVTYSKADAVTSPAPGYKPVLRANSITEGELFFGDLVYVPEEKISPRQYVKAGDVVIAASSGSLDVVGKAARALSDFDGGFGAFCKVLRPNEKVDAGYFAHFFQTRSYRQRVSSLAAGANINNLRNEHLNNLAITVPTLPEQRRIAAILDKADALRAKRREAIAKLDQLLQSVFLDMFGDPVTNPRRWPIAPIGENCEKVTVGIVVKPASYYAESGVPAIRSLNIRENEISTDNVVYFSEADNFGPLKKTILRAGDVVAVRSGQPGRAAVVPPSLDGSNAIDVLIARTKKRKLHPQFLAHFLNSSAGRRLVLAEQRGQVQKHLNVKQLAEAKIPLPPQTNQAAFVDAARRIDGQKHVLQRSADQLDTLFTGLQHRTFTDAL